MGTASPRSHTALDDHRGGILRIARAVTETAAMGHFSLLERFGSLDASAGIRPLCDGGIPAGKGLDPRSAGGLILTREERRLGNRSRLAGSPVRYGDSLFKPALVLSQTRVHDEIAVGAA